jgi:acyl transferase domain-containing protein
MLRTSEPIAVVGAGCVLPGGILSSSDLTVALRDGRDCISEIPPDRWSVDEFYDPDPIRPGKTIARHGGFVSGIDEFDAGFFGISGAEAARMDPQQRLLLQTVWHALEDGGQNPDELKGTNTGVFIGASNTNSYVGLMQHTLGFTGITGYDATGDAVSVAAGRVASLFGLQGPCLTVDTACSSSLVALHLARQSMLAGECDVAIVAGVNVIVFPAVHIAFSKAGLLSPTGQIRAFDSAADGYVRSEGCVAVLLRRESQAVTRGDRILASVVGTAVNHHGRSIAITAPDGRAQERVMRTALTQASVRPGQVGYIDAHGTGTPVGDPMEMRSIVEVYGNSRPSGQSLHVGSVKSNFGHLEAAAGLLGLLKAALSLDRETIFPSIHFEQLNPKIDLRDSDIRVPKSPVAWPRTDGPRLAAVNSFGYSGTNACAVLREAPRPEPTPETAASPHTLLMLSAKSEESLDELARCWEDFLSSADPALLSEAAFTAAVGRATLRHRLAVVAATTADAADNLRRWRARRSTAAVVDGRARLNAKIAYVFTGQGAQYGGMGRQLYEHEPVFAAAIDRCAAVIDPDLGRRLHDVVFAEQPSEEAENTRFAQPALFAIEYALAELLRSWGVEPAVVIGHSVGEIAAACVSGLLAFEDAARFSMLRGRLMGALPRGKMLAVAASEDVVRNWLAGRGDVVISGINGPRSVVVSGAAEAVDEVARLAEEVAVRATPLKVSHAFHSPLMDPILADLAKFAATFQPGRPTIPMVSTLTAAPLTGDEGARYWSRQARGTVRFHDGMRTVIESGCSAIVEVGPHPALSPVIAGAFGAIDTRLIQTLNRDGEDVRNMRRAAGALFVSGASLDRARLFGGSRPRRIAAPHYPFRRDRYWFSAGGPGTIRADAAAPESVAAQPKVPDVAARPVYEATLTGTTPWVDHRILRKTAFPGSGYLEMVIRASAAVNGAESRPVALRNVSFLRPLVLTPGKTVSVGVHVGKDSEGGAGFVFSGGEDEPCAEVVEYCHGTIAPVDAGGEQVPLDDLRAALSTTLAPGRFYGILREAGLEYGASFSTVRELWTGERRRGEALGRIAVVPDGAPAEDHEFRLSTMLDGSLQVAAAALGTLPERALEGAYLPFGLRQLTLSGPWPAQVWGHARVELNETGSVAVATLRVADDDGNLLAEMAGVELRHADSLTVTGSSGTPGYARRRVGDARAELVARLEPLSPDKRLTVVTHWIVGEIRDMLGRSAAENDFELDMRSLNPSSALQEIGLDSLMITEFQRRIQEKLDFRFAAMESIEYQGIANLAEYILDRVLALAPAE